MRTPIYYPPLPGEKYKAPVAGACSFTALRDMPQFPAIWNLLWLSVPALDDLGVTNPVWWRAAVKVAYASQIAMHDVLDNPDLAMKLIMPTDQFISWFKVTDVTRFGLHALLEKELWRQTVLDRAEEACRRLEGLPPARKQNKVISVDFSRAA